MQRIPVVILGAGGRDFHVFNTCYRDDPAYAVVAFTATQIPHIENRLYPPELAGPLYTDGIPIVDEAELEALAPGAQVVFAYSDVSRRDLRVIAERVYEHGGAFSLFDPDATMLRTKLPCVAVCAVRTGCGKSPISRRVAAVLKDAGMRTAILRHPMPYGDLRRQAVQRFATLDDLAAHECTFEEMEEYEPHIAAGSVVFAGADYEAILRAAEEEADVIVWDGGNNDTPFVRPDLWITVLDPLRPRHEIEYFPGYWNLQRADVCVLNKIDEASAEQIAEVRRNVARINPDARVVDGRMPLSLDRPDLVENKRVLVVEDGPTATHGGMGYGAGYLAAVRAGATVIDPRPFATGELAEAFQRYTHLEKVLPALGYGAGQVKDLEKTIAAADCDAVVVGTPIDLARVVRIDKPVARVTYGFEASSDGIEQAVLEAVHASA